jgi:hypothetical protein
MLSKLNNKTHKLSLLRLIKLILIFFALCLTTSFVQASPQSLKGTWYEVHSHSESGLAEDFVDNPLQAKNLQVVDSIAHTGGHYIYQANFEIPQTGEFVVDFKNTSTIAQFKHYIYSNQNQLIASLDGGIENASLNPFFFKAWSRT